MVVDPISRPHFHFIGIFAVGLGIGRAVSLAISRAVSTEVDVAVDFFGLFLW